MKQGNAPSEEVAKLTAITVDRAEGRNSPIDCREQCEWYLRLEEYIQAVVNQEYNTEIGYKFH
jgi:hypothetical protein